MRKPFTIFEEKDVQLMIIQASILATHTLLVSITRFLMKPGEAVTLDPAQASGVGLFTVPVVKFRATVSSQHQAAIAVSIATI